MTEHAPESPPMISVIVPTFMRPHRLEHCLEALALQSYPRDQFEVIVVDDGSGAPPTRTVAAFHDRIDVTLIAAHHGGPASARNVGVASARGTWLAFTDDDCMPEPRWLAVLAEHFARESKQGIGGAIVNDLVDSPYPEASQLLVSYLYEHYAGATRCFFCSNNLAFPASAFREVGGFDATCIGLTGEDRDLCERWRQHGGSLAYVPGALVRHAHQLTAWTFLRQHWRYGKDALAVYRQRERRVGEASRSGGEVRLSFYLGMLRYPFRHYGRGGRAVQLSALLAASQCSYAAGVLWAYARELAGGSIRRSSSEWGDTSVEARYD